MRTPYVCVCVHAIVCVYMSVGVHVREREREREREIQNYVSCSHVIYRRVSCVRVHVHVHLLTFYQNKQLDHRHYTNTN